MKKISIVLLLIVSCIAHAQQKVIQLYNGAAPGSENWTWDEAELDSNAWKTPVVYNVSHPTLTVFMPDSTAPSNNTAIIIAPGGGFYALSINSEGNDVAKWLVKKGITCFVLRYRLAHSLTNDPVMEHMSDASKPGSHINDSLIIPLSIADGKKAIAYVRQHASEYNVDPNKIGIIGFSAGGLVAAAAAFNYTADNKPDFVAPIYAGTTSSLQNTVAADAPPMFLAAASDDQHGLAHSIDLYNKWLNSNHSVELHLYAKGGHGFGMRVQNIPTDNWIDRFSDWLQLEGFTKGTASMSTQQADNMQRTMKDWPNIHRYEDDNEKIKTVTDKNRVVFMGNSITEGWKNIDSSFFSNNPYIDRGISGQTTPQMLVRFREDVIDLKPAVVVILAGINDIAQNTGPIKLEDTYGNIVSMAELAEANNIKVVITSTLPAYSIPWRNNMPSAEKVIQLNAMLKAYATKNKIVYVDYFTAMKDDRNGLPTTLSADGVHPNLAGYKIMEPLVQKGISDALKK